MPDTNFNDSSGGKAACEDKEVVVDHDGKVEFSRPDEFLGVALAAESTRKGRGFTFDHAPWGYATICRTSVKPVKKHCQLITSLIKGC